MTTPKYVSKEIETPNDELSDEDFLRELGVEKSTPTEEDALEAWGQRNKDALAKSIKEADEAFERGEYSSLEDVVAEVRASILARRD
jgi:hypothetical protein